jgi:type II secretory pathway predicted ATPase ExeA
VAIRSGGLIALAGIVGSGKIVTLRRLQEVLREDGKILVAKSLSVDKERVNSARSSPHCSTICPRRRTSRSPPKANGASAPCRR